MGKVLIEYLGEPNDLNSTTFEGIIELCFYDLDKVLTFANFHGDQNVIDDGGNIQCIYFYMPKLAPVSAIGRTGYSGTNKRFWHNRYRLP